MPAATQDCHIGDRAICNVDVPARAEIEATKGLEGAVNGGTWILEDCLSFTGVLVACAVVQPSSSTVTV